MFEIRTFINSLTNNLDDLLCNSFFGGGLLGGGGGRLVVEMMPTHRTGKETAKKI